MRRKHWIPFFLAALCLLAAAAHADSVKLLYPNGGEVLKAGTNVVVRWHVVPARSKVILILYKKGIKYTVVSRGTANNGRFIWKIPANLPAGNDYRIRIRLFRNLAVNDFSDRNFTIKK